MAKKFPQGGVLVRELAQGVSVSEAARRAGISRSTADRRLAEPDFRADVLRARQRLTDQATQSLADSADLAVKTLRGLLESNSDSVRLGSAKAILDGLLRFQEVEALTDRVRRLEASHGAVRSYLETLSHEEVETFYFQLSASLKGKVES